MAFLEDWKDATQRDTMARTVSQGLTVAAKPLTQEFGAARQPDIPAADAAAYKRQGGGIAAATAGSAMSTPKPAATPTIGSNLPTPGAPGSMATSSIGDLGGLKTSATSQPGISKVTGAGLSSPLYTNESDAGQAVAGIGQRMARTGITTAPASDAKPAFGPAAGLTITPFGGVNAAGVQNEGLARMAAANATRQSMIDGVGIAGPASGLSVSPLSGQTAPQNEGLARMARANAITQERIDAQPRGGAAVLGGLDAQGRTRQEQENDARSARWRQDELISQAKYLPQMAGIAGNLIQGDSQQAVEGLRQQGIAAGINTERRGQDLGYGAKMAQIGLTARGQDQDAAMGGAKLGIDMARFGLERDEAKRKAAEGNTDWRLQVTPTTRAADGTTTAGSIYRYNQRTGDVQRVDGGQQAGVPAGMTAIGRTPDGRTVYRDKNGKTVVQAS